MKIACVCVTYLRAHLLGRVIKCFLEQDYPADQRELIILDDAGEYRSQEGAGWKLISIDRRFRSLGEKRNAATALVSADVDAIKLWDDDDLYLPWMLTSTAAALKQAPLMRPSQVLYPIVQGSLRMQRHETGGLYHGGWAYTLETFYKVGGYSNRDNGEDQEFLGRLLAAGVETSDPCELRTSTNGLGFDPAYVYTSEQNDSYRMSWMGADGWEELGKRKHNGFKETIDISWPCDLRKAELSADVKPRPW